MRLVPLLVAGLATLIAAAPAAAQAPRSHAINASVQGGVVRTGTPVISAFLLRDNALGTGAGRLSVTNAANAPTATGTATAYLPGGTIRFRLNIRFGAPANNAVTVDGTGSATGGTGRFRGITGNLTLKGSQNTQTLVFTTRITGRLRW
jgi:hypothetical protein